MARAFVMGLQGKHERYIRVGAACKHFAAHSGPEHDPISRLKFDAVVRYSDSQIKKPQATLNDVKYRKHGIFISTILALFCIIIQPSICPQVQERDMRMTYLPAFKACIDAKAVGIMCSYNK